MVKAADVEGLAAADPVAQAVSAVAVAYNAPAAVDLSQEADREFSVLAHRDSPQGGSKSYCQLEMEGDGV